MQVASAAGHLEAVEALLGAKADIGAVGDNGETALMLACAQVLLTT
jgi:ankyrin repeat protein